MMMEKNILLLSMYSELIKCKFQTANYILYYFCISAMLMKL